MTINNAAQNNRRTPLLLICAIALLATSCAAIRQVTYPTKFVYVEQEEVSSLMHSLASSMHELEKLVNMDDTTAEKQQKILSELEHIEAETAFLASTADPIEVDDEQNNNFKVLRTNHLLLDEHIDDFRNEIATAKRQVMANPPNYYVIGQLTGGCNACHLQR